MDYKFTIITVTYNCADTIERTIRSVLDQSYKNIEYIIIDGMSDDGTREIVERYRSNISLYISEPDNGTYDAMNKALKYATGDIVEFLNGDDYFVDNHVIESVLEEYTKHPRTDVLVGKDDRILSTDIHNHGGYENLYIDSFFPHQAVFAKYDVFRYIGFFDLKYRYSADREWIFRAKTTGYKFCLVDDVYVHFEEGGLSSNYGVFLEEYLIAEEYLDKTGQSELIPVAAKRCNRIFGDYLIERFIGDREKKQELKAMWDKLLGGSDECIIWGYGKLGKMIIRSLEDSGKIINLVIDNGGIEADPNYRIEYYSESLVDKKVIVAASKPCEAIVNQMLKDNIPRNMIISLDDIKKYAFSIIDPDGIDRKHFKTVTGLNFEFQTY